MKANRRGFVRDERAVSEVVGYLIALAMSSVILVGSLTAFNMMRDQSADILTDRTVREIAARVATTVEEALEAGSRFPESDFERTLGLPKNVNGQRYQVELESTFVRVVADNAGPPQYDPDTGLELEVLGRAHLPIIPRAGVANLCGDDPPAEIQGGTCVVFSEEGELTVRYGETEVDGTPSRGTYLVKG